MEENNKELIDAINELAKNQVQTNNSIKELQEYLIIKDRQEEEAKQKEQEIAEEDALRAEEAKDIEKQEQQTRAEEQKSQDEIYTEQLQNVNTQIEATNGMIAGQYITNGIICGVLLLTILWNKLN